MEDCLSIHVAFSCNRILNLKFAELIHYFFKQNSVRHHCRKNEPKEVIESKIKTNIVAYLFEMLYDDIIWSKSNVSESPGHDSHLVDHGDK